jgi:hypothetical protein
VGEVASGRSDPSAESGRQQLVIVWIWWIVELGSISSPMPKNMSMVAMARAKSLPSKMSESIAFEERDSSAESGRQK